MDARPKHPHRGRHLLSLERRIYRHRHALEFFIAPVLVIGIAVVLRHIGLAEGAGTESLETLALAAWYTTLRIAVAYLLALICAIPLAIVATHSPLLQKILLPVFDILQSVPILAFFPLLIVAFLNAGLTEGAAICILFLTMLWSITFAVIGGIGLIPREIMYTAEVFGLRGWTYIRRVVLPAIVPQAVIGSILAVAQGWNIIIVAEVIRAYLPPDSTAHNLTGLGSMLVGASTSGNTSAFAAAITAVVLIIAITNYFVWQHLITYAQRFRFE